jgi:hypothetical protein
MVAQLHIFGAREPSGGHEKIVFCARRTSLSGTEEAAMDRPRPIGVERQDDGRNARDGDFGERIIYSGLLHAVETQVHYRWYGPYTLVI